MLQSDEIKLQSFELQDVIGKQIYCADGVKRYVESIAYSHAHPTRVLINEIQEEETQGGAWVHVLDLSCQMYKTPRPTPEQIAAFNRAMSSMRWVPDVNYDKQGNIVLPSGIVVPKT